MWGLSLVAVRRGLVSSCGAHTSHCGALSHCRVRALGTQASGAAAHRLSSFGTPALVALRQMGFSWVRDLTRVSCTGRFFTTEPPGTPCVQLFMWTHVFTSLAYIYIYIPRSELARACGNAMFNFLRNCKDIFQISCTILYFLQQFLHILAHIFFSSLKKFLLGYNWFTVVSVSGIQQSELVIHKHFSSFRFFYRLLQSVE